MVPAGLNPLLIAVTGKKNGVADLLVAHGADVKSKDRGGNTALHIAAQLGDAWSHDPRGGPTAVRQADGGLRAAQGSADAVLQLGDLEEATRFTVFDVDCDADVILGYSWLQSHGLAFLYESQQVCLCAEAGCSSGRTVRLDLVRPSPTPIGTASVLWGPALRRLIRTAGLEVPAFPRPTLWTPPPPGGAAGAHAAMLAAAQEDWASGVLASLATGGAVLADASGTELALGFFAIPAESV